MIGSIRVEVEKFAQLFFDTFLIVAQGVFVQKVTFLRFSRRVAYHAGCTAQQRYGFVTAPLEMSQHHNAA